MSLLSIRDKSSKVQVFHNLAENFSRADYTIEKITIYTKSFSFFEETDGWMNMENKMVTQSQNGTETLKGQNQNKPVASDHGV